MEERELTVISNRQLTSKTWLAELQSESELPPITGGQFLHIETPGKLLRRPFGILDYGDKKISFAYAVVGGGTLNLTQVKPGEKLNCLFPLGNGFTLKPNQRKIALLGGGLGVAPLYPVIKSYPDREFHAFLGFSTADQVILAKEFAGRCPTTVCTDDGTCGTKGLAAVIMKESGRKFDAVLACGPRPMLKYLKDNIKDIPVYVSMEERMGCGLGACLVCVCGVKREGATQNLRVCKDGPVFELDEVIL